MGHITLDLTRYPPRVICPLCGAAEPMWLPRPWWQFWGKRKVNKAFAVAHRACQTRYLAKIKEAHND